jgi:uncharacterized membrane protein (DUF373 family)
VKLVAKNEAFFLRITVYFSTFIRYILNALLILICIALIIGILKSGYDLYQSLNKPLATILQKMLVDTVFAIALVEIAITILGYLKDGQVHVRYIVDTILIIMLNEVVVLWFNNPELQEMIGLALIISVLAAVRISVTRFAPRSDEEQAKAAKH